MAAVCGSLVVQLQFFKDYHRKGFTKERAQTLVRLLSHEDEVSKLIMAVAAFQVKPSPDMPVFATFFRGAILRCYN